MCRCDPVTFSPDAFNDAAPQAASIIMSNGTVQATASSSKGKARSPFPPPSISTSRARTSPSLPLSWPRALAELQKAKWITEIIHNDIYYHRMNDTGTVEGPSGSFPTSGI